MLGGLEYNTAVGIAAAGVLTALGCWLLLYGALLLIGGRDARVRARVREFVIRGGQAPITEAQERARMRAALFSNLDTHWERRTLFSKLRDDLRKANLRITLTELILIQLSAGFAMALVLWVALPSTFACLLTPVGFIIGLLLVRSAVRYVGRRRIARFEDQLPNTLAVLATSVRGGFSLFQALQLVAKESTEPIKTEFLRVVQEVSLGANLDTALEGLAARVPTEDVEILVTAISLQHQTGGNLSHVLDVVADTVRERHRVRREVRSLTAQQRFSATLLTALPYLLTLVMFLISPGYVARLFKWDWVLCMPIGMVVLSIIGFITMRKLGSIDV